MEGENDLPAINMEEPGSGKKKGRKPKDLSGGTTSPKVKDSKMIDVPEKVTSLIL